MRLVNCNEVMPAASRVATIGMFDGVHLGHATLIAALRNEAARTGLHSMVITFDRHPQRVLNEQSSLKMLQTLDDRIQAIAALQPDELLVMPFTRDTAATTACQFLQLLHDRYGVTTLIVGYNHRFGHNKGETFEDYCRHLTRIRYRDGLLDGYASRNHYFTQWIQSNERQGIVRELTAGQAPFTAVQTLDLHFMSDHPQYYPMLKSDTAAQRLIRHYELADSGRPVRYIPRSQLNQLQDSPLGVVRDGDILAIVTRKDGLDTSHIGLAVWGRDRRLHLLNASQIHKQVVLEPMTLYQYMGKHPSQLGIRVIRPLF